ncbi:MAG: hypothetical protein PVF69_12310, partial [Gemmatimonadota bacterium]
MPRPEPWVLALAAAFSAVIAVLVVFQAVMALRDWRMRRNVLGSLRSEDRDGRAPQPGGSVVRAKSDGPEGPLAVLAERIPQLWDLHHLLSQSGLSWSLESFLLRTVAVATLSALVTLVVSGSAVTAAVTFVVGASAPYV